MITADESTTEPCPHCREQITRTQFATHITTTHSDLPPCTAAYFTGHHSVDCLFRTPHLGGPYADYHMNGWDQGPAGHYLWTDTADGALPHGSSGSTEAQP